MQQKMMIFQPISQFLQQTNQQTNRRTYPLIQMRYASENDDFLTHIVIFKKALQKEGPINEPTNGPTDGHPLF